MKTGVRLAIALAACLSPLVPLADSAAAPADAEVLQATLKNGLRVVIVRDPLAPVITTEVNYLVGSNEAPAGFPGMAHAQEHMMFRGSPGLSAEQLADIMAAMGGQFNADTQQTITQYFLTVPAEDLEVALHVEALRMSGVLDTEKLWGEERGAIEQEVVQDLSNPQYTFYTQLLSALFRGTPFEHDALGTKESFDKTTGAMLKSFYDAWYAPNNAILVVVGDVEPRDALAKVEREFGAIPARKVPAHPEVKLQPVLPQTLELRTDLPYGMAVISFRMPGMDSPDYAAAQILGDVLSSQRGELYELVPAGKALYAGFFVNGLPIAGVGGAMAAFPPGADSQALLKELGEIVAKEVKEGLPAELVEAAKRHELADYQFERNSVSGLAESWSQALAVEGRGSPEDDVRALSSVTVEDVNRVARAYLDQEHAILAVLTPESSGQPVAAKGFGGAESFAPKNPKAVALPVWAEKALANLRVPTSTLKPVVHKLANGLTLILQPESISDTVSVYGSVRNEPKLETPAGQDGVDELLGQLFSYGSTSLDRLAFQKALDDIGAEESAGVGFSLQVLPAHFERGVELLAENLLHPALPADDFKIVQGQLAREAGGVLASPDYLAEHALREGLFPQGDSHPATGHAGQRLLADPRRREGLLPEGVPARAHHHRGDRSRRPGEGRGRGTERLRSVDGRKGPCRILCSPRCRSTGPRSPPCPTRAGFRTTFLRRRPWGSPAPIRTTTPCSWGTTSWVAASTPPACTGTSGRRGARVLRQVDLRREPDARRLQREVRLRPSQGGQGAEHRGARPEGDAAQAGDGLRAPQCQGAGAPGDSSLGGERAGHRARPALPGWPRPSARRAHPGCRALLRHERGRNPGRLCPVGAAGRPGPGDGGTVPAVRCGGDPCALGRAARLPSMCRVSPAGDSWILSPSSLGEKEGEEGEPGG